MSRFWPTTSSCRICNLTFGAAAALYLPFELDTAAQILLLHLASVLRWDCVDMLLSASSSVSVWVTWAPDEYPCITSFNMATYRMLGPCLDLVIPSILKWTALSTGVNTPRMHWGRIWEPINQSTLRDGLVHKWPHYFSNLDSAGPY